MTQAVDMLLFACREALAAINELPADMQVALVERFRGHHAIDVARDVLEVAIQKAQDTPIEQQTTMPTPTTETNP